MARDGPSRRRGFMARRDDEHRYSECGQDDCPRFPCRAYTEGYVRGYAEGAAAGYAAGGADGLAQGYAAALLLPIVLAAGHPHLRRADLALAVAAAAVIYILLDARQADASVRAG